jgi:cytochrome c oxidase subunit 2
MRGLSWLSLSLAAPLALGCAGPGPAEPSTTSAPTSTPNPTSGPSSTATSGSPDLARGARLFASLGCGACHGAGKSAGPALDKLFGSTLSLEGGGTVTVDDAYLRESIVAPAAKLRAGQRALMPSYQGKLSDEDLHDLVAHLKTL